MIKMDIKEKQQNDRMIREAMDEAFDAMKDVLSKHSIRSYMTVTAAYGPANDNMMVLCAGEAPDKIMSAVFFKKITEASTDEYNAVIDALKKSKQ